MRLIKWSVLILGVLALAAIVTRPDREAAERTLKRHMLLALAREEVGGMSSAAGDLVLAGCKMNPEGCYRLVRGGMETRFESSLFTSRFDVSGFGKVARCHGAFTVFVCPGGLRDR